MYKQRLTIPEDGIVDEVAIDVTVRGLRPVNLTETERSIAAHLLAVKGFGIMEIAERLSRTQRETTQILAQTGWEVIPDPTAVKHSNGNALLITRVDRPRGPKISLTVGNIRPTLNRSPYSPWAAA